MTDADQHYLPCLPLFKKLLSEEKLRVRACRQVDLLNDKIEGLLDRYYHPAWEFDTNGFCYNLDMRIATMEGVRNLYREYAKIKEDEVRRLRRQLLDELTVIMNNEYGENYGSEDVDDYLNELEGAYDDYDENYHEYYDVYDGYTILTSTATRS